MNIYLVMVYKTCDMTLVDIMNQAFLDESNCEKYLEKLENDKTFRYKWDDYVLNIGRFNVIQ